MNITTRHLAPLASELTGKRVAVEIGHDLGSADGVASHDGTQYVIQIHPRHFKQSAMGTLAYCFLHECGHIARGHVPLRSNRTDNKAIGRETQQTINNDAYMTSKHAERIEAEAHSWAWSHAKAVPAWRVWDLVTSD